MNYAYLISTILITALLSLINPGVYAYDGTLYPDMWIRSIRIRPPNGIRASRRVSPSRRR